MTIASEIQRIQTNIANAYDALEAKGATMPATENTDNLVTTIDTISGGGGDIVTATNNTGSSIATGDKVWINESNGSYSIENPSKIISGNIVGNVVINTDYIASGFSFYNYIKSSKNSIFGTGNKWELVTKIKATSNSGYRMIFCTSASTSTALNIILTGGYALTVQNSDIFFQGSTNGSDLDIDVNCSIPINTEVWIKVEYTGTEYNLYTSTNGTSWTLGASLQSSTKLYQNNSTIRLGSANSSYTYPFEGTIDLDETYVKMNDENYWKCVDEVIYVTENSLTGYAQENIASGSTGDVLTLLPPEPASKKKRLVSVADDLDTNKLVLYTDDGINWNTSTMPNSRNWGNPFYGDGKFIIADYTSGIFAYSSDGINWTEGTAFSTQYNTYTVLKGYYGNGVYLLACNTGNTGTGYLFKSTDGINWTDGYNFYDVSDSPGKMIDFIFDGNRFVAFFKNSVCQYSTDGISWTKAGRPFNNAYEIPNNRATTIYDSVNSRYIHSAAFYASGTTATYEQHIYTSTDLTNWTEVFSVAYNNVNPITSCILGGETKIFNGWTALSQQSAGYINVDSTGTATFVGSSVPRLNYQGGANIINDRAVVIGYGSDQYIYSTDGTTWNTGTLPASSGWWGSCVGEVD